MAIGQGTTRTCFTSLTPYPSYAGACSLYESESQRYNDDLSIVSSPDGETGPPSWTAKATRTV